MPVASAQIQSEPRGESSDIARVSAVRVGTPAEEAYRLQLSKQFGFDAAARVVPYLKSLGISHVYASPFLKARAGSTHGYDIVDHNQFNPELGGEAGFMRLSETLRRHDLGLILDFVPNHVGVHYADNLGGWTFTGRGRQDVCRD